MVRGLESDHTAELLESFLRFLSLHFCIFSYQMFLKKFTREWRVFWQIEWEFQGW